MIELGYQLSSEEHPAPDRHADEAEARRIAHRQWTAPAAIPARPLTKLRVPADFEAVAELIGEDEVFDASSASPIPTRTCRS